jgi:hypothetical protein
MTRNPRPLIWAIAMLLGGRLMVLPGSVDSSAGLATANRPAAAQDSGLERPLENIK